MKKQKQTVEEYESYLGDKFMKEETVKQEREKRALDLIKSNPEYDYDYDGDVFGLMLEFSDLENSQFQKRIAELERINLELETKLKSYEGDNT
jgi:hypothetical protein